MIRIKIFLLLLCSFSLAVSAQNPTDSLRKRAKEIIYDQPEETIKIVEKLLLQEKKADERAHLYMLISNAYIAKRNNDSSLFYILKATDLINTTTLITTKIKILNSVAVQYQQMELYDKALESLDRALVLTEKLPFGDKDRVFYSAFNSAVHGMIYRNQSNPDLALKKFKLAAQNFHELKADSKTLANLSIIYYNMGNCYLDLLKFQEAAIDFKKAENFAKDSKTNSLEAYALKGQGESLFLNHFYKEALTVLYRAEKLAESSGDLVLNEGLYRLLASSNLAINNFEKFQHYNTKYLAIQKNLEQNELKSLNRDLNTQELEQRELNSKVQKMFRLYEVLTLIFAFAILFFILQKIIKLKKKNLRQKKILETMAKAKQIV